jgi:hypothetical protein
MCPVGKALSTTAYEKGAARAALVNPRSNNQTDPKSGPPWFRNVAAALTAIGLGG